MQYRERLYGIVTFTYRNICLNALLLCLPMLLAAQNLDTSETVSFKVFVNGQPWGNISVLCDSTACYMNLPEILDLLEYKYELQPESKQLKGFTSARGEYYIIDNEQLKLSTDSVSTKAHILWGADETPFIRSDYLYNLYNLQSRFTKGSLVVNLITTQPVPAVLRVQREAHKQKLLKQREDSRLTNIDTVRRRNLRVNAIGYNIAPGFSSSGSTNLSLQGNMNGEIMKGSFLVNYNYSSLNNRSWNNNLTFAWNRPVSGTKWIRSVGVYHDYSNLVTSTNGFMTALTVSNERQNSYLSREYVYQGKTTPDTEVEIYNNGTLIQYVHSDSLGHYEVEIPTFGGDNKIVAVSYDSFGLPLSSEELIYMPPNMQAKRRLSYRLTTGYTDDGSIFFAPMAVYGLTSYLTLSAANETVFGSENSTSIAILGAKLAASKKLRIDMNYVPTVKWDVTLSANIAHLLNGNFTYERFEKGQQVVRYSPRQRLLMSFNGDIPIKRLRGNYYISSQYYQFAFGESFSTYVGIFYWWKKILTNISVSTASDRVRLNNFVYTIRAGYNFNPRLYNELTAEYRAQRSDVVVRNRTNYQFKNRLVAFAEAEYGFKYKRYIVSCGLTWRLPWAQIKAGATNTNRNTSGYLGVSGSAIFQRCGVAFSERYVAGSSLRVVMYVDKNGNNAYDKGEPVYKDANVLVHAAGEEQRTDKGILFTNIPANYAFKVVIPTQSFPDITWQIKPQQINLYFSSYQSRSIYLPIKVVSEISGRIYVLKNGQKSALSDVPITITELNTGAVVCIKSDEWGYYNHMGFVCGNYSVKISDTALSARGLRQESANIAPVSFAPSLEGEQIDLPDMVLVEDR